MTFRLPNNYEKTDVPNNYEKKDGRSGSPTIMRKKVFRLPNNMRKRTFRLPNNSHRLPTR